MAERILYPEFRDELEFTHYPFADGVTLRSTDTNQQIDVDTFLDASLYPIGATTRVHIASIQVSATRVVLQLGDSNTTNLAAASFDPLEPPGLLRFTDNYGRPAGVVVSEPLRLARFSAWATGTHTFRREATEFVASCVIPTPEPGVRGLLTEAGELLTGDIWLVGENGVVLRQETNCTIRIDIIGDPLFVRKLCDPVALFTPPNFIRTINGFPPDSYGNYNLTVGNNRVEDTVLRVVPTDTGLRIEVAGSTLTNPRTR